MTINSIGLDKLQRKNSITLRGPKPDKVLLQENLSFKNLVQDKPKSSTSKASNGLTHKLMPTLSLPQPTASFSSSPASEHEAAVRVQKVYKSYRTRRNLADCAVVAEELWWKEFDVKKPESAVSPWARAKTRAAEVGKGLSKDEEIPKLALQQWWTLIDLAELKQSSVSFFNVEKPESAVSRWARAKTRAAKVGKGLSKDEKAKKLALQHWLEAIDPRHRYGHNLHLYYDVWFLSESAQPFFYWLDVGDGKEVNLDKCPRKKLQQQCITYLGPKEREQYEVIVENGRLIYRQSGSLVDTSGLSKWIFVLSTSRALYVGRKEKGKFQHSSFMAGGATTAAGRLVARDGVLEAIWPYSGHYHPTEENFMEFISFLEESHVNLANVKKCAVDDDYSYGQAPAEETKPESAVVSDESKKPNNVSEEGDSIRGATTTEKSNEQIKPKDANKIAPVFNPAQRMSYKWSSGVGPRITCVRDYPTDMQSKALEQVKLSPRVTPLGFVKYGPIPSPRPSPRIHLSPSIAGMGLPSPRPAPSPRPITAAR